MLTGKRPLEDTAPRVVSRLMLRYLLFDLDNTLYSDSTGLERATFARICAFTADFLGMETQAALELRKSRMRFFGTTLEWLMTDHGFTDIEGFFAAVHPEGEEFSLQPDPGLGLLLDRLDLPKAIFTNAPMEHALRILRKLGIEDRFEAIYDIRFSGFRGKPAAEAFARVCAACGTVPEDTLFVDDLPPYVQGFVDIGGRGVLIDELDRHPESRLTRIHGLAELSSIVSGERAAESQLGLFS